MSRLRLRLKTLTFVSTEQEAERGPDEHVLDLDQKVFDGAIDWVQSRGWRAPGRSVKCRRLHAVAVAEFVRLLRAALAADADTPDTGPRARNRFSTEHQHGEFFAVRSNRRQLATLLELLEQGGDLDVEDAPEPLPARASGGRGRGGRPLQDVGRAARRAR